MMHHKATRSDEGALQEVAADLRPAHHKRGAGACLRIGIHFYIYLHHTWSCTQTPRTPGALYGCLHGPVAQFRSMRLCSVQHAPLARDQPQCGRAADCPAHWLATIESRRRRASQLRLPLQRRPHGSLKKAAISR